jgi:hypothetical protein
VISKGSKELVPTSWANFANAFFSMVIDFVVYTKEDVKGKSLL